jgi:hypothetical protein
MIDAEAEGQRFEVRSERLHWIEPELAAAMLFTLQKEAGRWLRDAQGSWQQRAALEDKIEDVTRLLMEHAPGHVAVFPADESEGGCSQVSAVLVRFTAELRETVSRLAQIVRENQLTHVARGLDRGDCGWRVRYGRDPERFISATTTLYVTASELWVEARSGLSQSVFKSQCLSLWDVVPEDELGVRATELPRVLNRSRFEREADALHRLRDAHEVFESGLASVREPHERPNVGEEIPEAMKRWLSAEQRHALEVTRDALGELDEQLAEWETQLELEEQRLGEALLGVRPGDIAIAEVRGKTRRLFVEHVTAHVGRGSPLAVIQGRPFRQDGKPGKRREMAFIRIPWDPDESPAVW